MLPSSEPSASTSTFNTMHINAGGGADFTDSNGTIWSADNFFNGGTTWNARNKEITGTVDDELYRSERYSSGQLNYEIPVPSGVYEVSLFAAENYVTDVGKRVFSVEMENEVVFKTVDIFSESGGPSQAWVRKAIVSVSDGFLTIRFGRITQNPKVSGVRIEAVSGSGIDSSTLAPSNEPSESSSSPTYLRSGSPSQQPSTRPSPQPPVITSAFDAIYINTGGSEYIDSNGRIWTADAHFNTGKTFSASGGIEEPYLSERWDSKRGDELVYNIPNIPPGSYDVTLHMSENYVDEAGKHIFNVLMEDLLVFENLDIFAQAGGGFKALAMTETVAVTDGSLKIEFIHVVENPKVSKESFVRHMEFLTHDSHIFESRLVALKFMLFHHLGPECWEQPVKRMHPASPP